MIKLIIKPILEKRLTILFFVVGSIFLLIVVALVVIILYRAPEYVLKSKNYGIMDELYRLKPLFPVQSEFGQIDKIFKILGTPNYEKWSEGYRFMENLNMKSPTCNKKIFEIEKTIIITELTVQHFYFHK